MREHPIPQDITNYRFHIIGNMTLKQFGLLGFGCLLALLVYSTNIFWLFKWPLVVFFVGVGVVAAFIPIADRPLDHWIMTFFRNLYKPTLFFWRREEHIPLAFLYTTNQDNTNLEPEINLGPARRERIIEYMRSINNTYMTKDEYTTEELLRMQSITIQFDSVVVPSSIQRTPTASHRPSLGVKVRKINPEIAEQVLQLTNDSTDNNTKAPAQVIITQAEQTTPNHKLMLSSDQVAQKIAIPEEKAVTTEHSVTEEDEHLVSAQLSQDDQFFIEAAKSQGVVANQQIHYNTELPFPSRPKEPNKLVGMVLSQGNDLITDAIVEIQTLDGHIVRAVKTNALGQFFVTTPLKNGEYVLSIEKQNLSFEPQKISLSGKVVDPIEVRSTT